MKHFVLLLFGFALLFSLSAEAAMPHKHYPKEGGHYVGSYSKKHKGGHYMNPRTGNHYTRH